MLLKTDIKKHGSLLIANEEIKTLSGSWQAQGFFCLFSFVFLSCSLFLAFSGVEVGLPASPPMGGAA